MKTMKKALIPIICLLLTVAGVVAATFAWLADDYSASTKGMEMVLYNPDYNIHVIQTNKYETIMNYFRDWDSAHDEGDKYKITVAQANNGLYVKDNNDYDVTLNNVHYRLATSDDTGIRYDLISSVDNNAGTYYKLNNKTSGALAIKEHYAGYTGIADLKQEISGSLYAELDNEVEYKGTYYLMPGTYGSLTIYIEKKVAGDITVTLNIGLSGYKLTYDQNDNYSLQKPIEDSRYQKALEMLKGHILFFENRVVDNEGNPTQFSSLVGSTYEYSTEGKTPEANGYYKITLYWIWPLLYNDLLDTTKYGAEVRDYVSAHPEYFFGNNITQENYSSADDNAKEDGYNDGDRFIGDNIHFLLVTIE